MSLATDQRYASMLSPYVRNFAKKNNVWNFSCPVCGDSKRSKSKARGYLYPGPNRLLYKCHNCSAPSNFYKLLVQIDPNLAKEYLTDRFLEDKQEEMPEPERPFAPPKFHDTIDEELIKISSLDPSHPAKRYVVQRLIPSEQHHKLFYIADFRRWANHIAPGTFDTEKIFADEPRLIIPLIDKNHKVMGYQGRSLQSNHPVKYITVLVDPQAIKMYGLDTVSLNKTIRVFEGPLDAMFIPNAIATTGGRQDTLLQQAGISKDRTILVYDNEPRSKETIEKMEKALNNGWTVCVWPESIKENDVNAMVLSGKSAKDITEIIDSHAYSGLMGLAMLSSWRKI